jgi:hypothetical protein
LLASLAITKRPLGALRLGSQLLVGVFAMTLI